MIAAHATHLVPASSRVEAFGWSSLNPVHWLGSSVSKAAANGWEAAMTAMFSAAMWLLQLTFHVIDAFTTPDLSATGPLGAILPTTYWIAGALGAILFSVQLCFAAFRHDGKTLAQTLIGIAQFGAVWVGFLGFATAIVVAMAGLEHGILSATLHVTNWSSWTTGSSWPKKVDDVTIATVLGLGVGFLVGPSSFAYLLLMLVREAGLLVLVATSPIASAGLLAQSTRTWFWKMLRWFLAAAAMAPLIALVVGMGVRMTSGVLSSTTTTTTTTGAAAQVGQAVVSACLLAVGALSPVVLFKLLAFVDPNTASGQAMRSSLSENGGLSGLLSGSGGGSESGSDAASQQASDGSGRSAGEAQSDDATSGRVSAAMSAASGVGAAVMAGVQAVAGAADKTSAFAESALGGAGVGHGGQGEGGGGNGGRPSSGSNKNESSTGGDGGGQGRDPSSANTAAQSGSTGSADGDTLGGGSSDGGDGGGVGRDGKGGAPGAPGPSGEQGSPSGLGQSAPAGAPNSPAQSASGGGAGGGSAGAGGAAAVAA